MTREPFLFLHRTPTASFTPAFDPSWRLVLVNPGPARIDNVRVTHGRRYRDEVTTIEHPAITKPIGAVEGSRYGIVQELSADEIDQFEMWWVVTFEGADGGGTLAFRVLPGLADALPILLSKDPPLEGFLVPRRD